MRGVGACGEVGLHNPNNGVLRLVFVYRPSSVSTVVSGGP